MTRFDRSWGACGDNSVWSLVSGYNGLGRLFGQSGGPGAVGGFGGPGGAGGGPFGGSPGVGRLLNEALGGPLVTGLRCSAAQSRAWARGGGG